jgi:hypothetical protein
MPLLVIERGNDKGLTVKMEPAKAYVGGRENPAAAIQLTDPMASRSHFQISSVNGSWRIKDMKSRNGTLLNDEKLKPDVEQEIKIGDKVQVGETIFSFLSDQKEETTGGGLTGKTIGGYQLMERIGRGGMGTVYRAEQISLKRIVALKVLSAKLLSDPVFVEKFVQEARAAGGLTHPNIVQVIDVGSDRGIYFFSMEYMDNGSVGDVVAKEGPVPWQRALEMMTDAAKGLIFAEKKGIIHRDIKPDNLMLTSEGAVKIGDLGLAKKTTDVAGEGGQIFGTPHFIAPEQAQGKPIDNRADLYALGATFYRVLTGKTPFTGENVKEILLKQIQEEPKPVQDLVKDLPDEIAAVLAKLMKKKPDDRYRSAQGLAEDLERIRVRYHLEAHGAAASARRTKVIAALLGLAVLGLGAVVYHFATKAPPEPERIVIPNNAPPPPPPEKLTPDQLADIAYSQVSEKYNDLFKKLQGGPGATWRNEKDWLPVADQFEAMAKAHPDTAKGKKAQEEAEDIRSSIQKAKAAWQAKNDKVNEDWKKGLAEASGSMEEGRWSEAILRLVRCKAEMLKDENREFLPPDAAKVLKDRINGVVRAAAAKVGTLDQAAKEAAPKFPGADFPAAYGALAAVREGLRLKDAGRDEDLAEAKRALDELDRKVETHLQEHRDVAESAAAAAIEKDEAAYYSTYLRIRRWQPEGSPADALETPFFGYRWDEAIAKWEALRKTLNTDWFRARVDLKIQVYRRCKRVFETIAAKVKSGEIKDAGFPKSVKRGADLALDGTQRDKATVDGVAAVRLPSREKVMIRFLDMTPEELYQDFLREGKDIPYSGEDHLDLAAFLAEAGRGDWGGNEKGTAMGGRVPAADNKPLTDWIDAESVRYYDYWLPPNGVGALWNKYVGRRNASAGPTELNGIRKEIEERAEALRQDERWYTGDLSILHCSEAGPDGPVPDRLMPVAVSKEILRTLGVPGGPGLPPEEEAPPPPPRDDRNGKVPDKSAGDKPAGDGTPGAEGTVKPGGDAPAPPAPGAGGKDAKDGEGKDVKDESRDTENKPK